MSSAPPVDVDVMASNSDLCSVVAVTYVYADSVSVVAV